MFTQKQMVIFSQRLGHKSYPSRIDSLIQGVVVQVSKLENFLKDVTGYRKT